MNCAEKKAERKQKEQRPLVHSAHGDFGVLTFSQFPSRTPIADDLERRIGPNPSERSFGKSLLVYCKATKDKCDSSWAYLSSYVYHQPSQTPKNLAKTTTGPIVDDLER